MLNSLIVIKPSKKLDNESQAIMKKTFHLPSSPSLAYPFGKFKQYYDLNLLLDVIFGDKLYCLYTHFYPHFE
ncbi:hypothetical protein SBF1_2470006 [Candidatus Desulfosporosinus infrequens]|uniref:Uncharacterized protein n=1 Tax=Candidatus Desulfosporosinus infrequens TaxID=2043169 RepID=A0A2U3KNK6_9FIRM|nr:hypothetical protein SBF1_2470006 [Candidatus Desulfosporosinus infrequens]